MPIAETQNLPSVSVIICAYTEDRWDDLVAGIQSLKLQTTPPQETLVVVDHNPTLLQRIRTQFPTIIAIENTEARGLSGARNSGINVATSEIIAFIDDDAVAAPDWLTQLIKYYADPKVLGVGGAIEPTWLSGKPTWFPDEFAWVVGCTYRGMPQKVQPIRNLIGCNMSFRKIVFEEVGGFQNGIGRIGTRPLGCEETELCIRVQQRWADSTFIYEPAAKVQHRVPKIRSNWYYFRERCYAEGLSKAMIAQLVGSKDGLSSERAYTLRTLPQGIIRGVIDALTQLRPDGILRAGAILLGLVLTTAGYLRGTFAKLSPNAD